VRVGLGGLLLTLAACADGGPSAAVPLDGSYTGSNSVYAEVSLTVTETADAVTGGLLLRDHWGELVFTGPVAGARTGASAFEVSGGRAPSVGGGTVTVQGRRAGTGMQVTLVSSWLPSTTIALGQQVGQ
jgi:hypothetical protein